MTLTDRTARVAAETPAKAEVRSWKAPIALAVFTVLYALLILAVPRVGVTTFRISTQSDALQLPEIVVPVGDHDVGRVRSAGAADDLLGDPGARLPQDARSG